ncbi:hypothetical protein E2C01_093326 [Portunus trituberculatus]|uniref:Uncharacterized protein n=1 Tax=Portunus trituberculatus TaxID=210409 RepID=A0A5B7JT39_PORTR|nr:hypothetical protein [Portunus trituberculatus]
MMPIYSNLQSIPSFQLASDVAEIVFEGTLEDLLEGSNQIEVSVSSPITTSLQPTSTPSPTPPPIPSPSTGNSEPPSDIANLRKEFSPTPHSSKKRKLSNKQDPVRNTLLNTLESVQTKVQKEEEFLTTCVRSFMEFTPHSSTKDTEKVAKIKDKFIENVFHLIFEAMKEINSEATDSA